MHPAFVSRSPWARPLAGAFALVACATAHAAPDSLGAFGWAAPAGSAQVATGGQGADAAHTYTVRNRNELVLALYPDAQIADDGSFSSVNGADPTPKIIYVKAKIDLSTNKAGRKLGLADFKDPAFDFSAYVAAFQPSVWNADPANWDAARNRPKAPSGAQEDARQRSASNQARITTLPIGSNTSLLGVGHDPRIVNGMTQVIGVSNVVIRNIRFEDAFDHFPAWDPTDSFALNTAVPGCQAGFIDAAHGPQRCPGGRWNSNYDLVQVRDSTYVWVDHNDFNDGDREDWRFPSVFAAPHVGLDYHVQHHDGAVDVVNTSNFVTLSHNRFQNHDKTLLLGGSNTATPANGWGALSITVAYNEFKNIGQRMPRVRFGKVHVFNNFLSGKIGYLGALAPTSTEVKVPHNRFLYGMGIGNLAKLYIENNVFDIQDAPDAPGTGQAVDASVTFFAFHGADQTIDGVLETTYFYDAGSQLNGKPVDIAAAAAVASVAAGKPVPQSTPAVWSPSNDYSYRLVPTRDVKHFVKANAGAGILK